MFIYVSYYAASLPQQNNRKWAALELIKRSMPQYMSSHPSVMLKMIYGSDSY